MSKALQCHALALLICLLTGGCMKQEANNSVAEAAARPEPSGINGLALGSSFEDVIGSLRPNLFNPVSLKECFDDLPLLGCSLSRNENAVFMRKNGIPYALQLSFNRLDKLTDIQVSFRREKQISAAQCKDIMARTVDWTTEQYGALTIEPVRRRWSAKERKNVDLQRTPQGHEVAFSKAVDDTGYTSLFHRLARTPFRKARDDAKAPEEALERTLTVFSSYIVVGGDPICDVDVSIEEPAAVERRVQRAEEAAAFKEFERHFAESEEQVERP